MGRRASAPFHRGSHPSLHYRDDQARRGVQRAGCLRECGDELSDLVGGALLRSGDAGAGASPLSWRVELGAEHRRQSGVTGAAASPAITRAGDSHLGRLHRSSGRGLRRVGEMTFRLDAHVPGGPLAEKWSRNRFEMKLVNPANKRKNTIIVVGSGLAGGAAAATMSELGYNVKCFCFQDSPRRAHSIAAQGGINAAKNYQNDGDSIYRLFYDTVKGGDFRSREANVYRLAQLCVEIFDPCVAQGVPFAREYGGVSGRPFEREYGGVLANRSFGGAQVSRTFYARGQTGQQLLIGAYQQMQKEIDRGGVTMYPRTEMLDLIIIEGRARGIVTRDMVSGKVSSHVGDAVVLGTGGYSNVF